MAKDEHNDTAYKSRGGLSRPLRYPPYAVLPKAVTVKEEETNEVLLSFPQNGDQSLTRIRQIHMLLEQDTLCLQHSISASSVLRDDSVQEIVESGRVIPGDLGARIESKQEHRRAAVNRMEFAILYSTSDYKVVSTVFSSGGI